VRFWYDDEKMKKEKQIPSPYKHRFPTPLKEPNHSQTRDDNPCDIGFVMKSKNFTHAMFHSVDRAV